MSARILIFVVIALVISACGGAAERQILTARSAAPPVIAVESKLLDTNSDAGIPEVGQVAPEFQFTMPDGTTRKLSDLRGKKVLINFWATWCEPCREEMPGLQKVHETYGDDLVILGVNKAENLSQVTSFAIELGLSFLLVVNPSADISDRYWARNIPLSYFINTDGTIGYRKLGIMDVDFVKDQLDQLK